MNTYNSSRALTVYVGEKTNKKKVADIFFQRIHLFLDKAYQIRRKELLFFFVLYLFFVFVGACLSAKENFASFYLYSLLLSDSASLVITLSLVVLALFSFSIIGKFISPIVCCVYSFFIGLLIHSIYIDVLVANKQFALAFVILFSFVLCLFLCECFLFSKKSEIGKYSMCNSKSIILYVLFIFIALLSIRLITRSFINILMVG